MAGNRSVKCRVCGAENPPENEYCDSCGVKLEAAPSRTGGEVDRLLEELIETPSEGATTPAKGGERAPEVEKELVDELLDSLLVEEGAQAPSEEFECPLCGTPLPVNAEVCARCGARFAKVGLEEAPAEKPLPAPGEEAVEKPVSVSVTEEDISKLKVSHGRLIDITVLGTLIAIVVIFVAGGMYNSASIGSNPGILVAFIAVVTASTVVGYLLLQMSSSAMVQGDKLVKAGSYQDAIYYYDRAIRMGTKPASAWASKGVALKRLGKLDEALHCQNVAVKLKPKYVAAWLNRGEVLARLGMRDEAAKCLEKAKSLGA